MKQDTTISEKMYPIDVLSTSLGKCSSSFLFNIDANYPWIECKEDTFAVAPEGSSKTFAVECSDSVATWTVNALSDNEMTDIPDWISYTLSGAKDTATIEFTVPALPAGTVWRTCPILVYEPGAFKIFTINQGAAGVATVKAAASARVIPLNGDFLIQPTGAITSVRVFNAAGQLMRVAQLNGATVIPAQNMAHGLYIFKFNNGATVKSMN
jgi:hypothetical protein